MEREYSKNFKIVLKISKTLKTTHIGWVYYDRLDIFWDTLFPF
jgi:hypothetical protein